MTPEKYAEHVRETHRLSSFHIFDQEGKWRVFGFRRDAKGFQASVEDGEGVDILSALHDLDRRLIEGPIHK